MALFKGLIASEISGKVGGTVFAHNAGGQYIRQLRVPTNPNSPAQQEVRQNFGNSAIAWRDTLTEAQRQAWNAIGPTVEVVNRLGDTRQLTGQQAYVRAYSLAQLGGLADPSTAPAATGSTELGTLSNLTLTAPDEIEVTVNESPAWAASDDGRLFAFVGVATSEARNFYRGPFRFAEVALGNATTPITTAAFNIPAGNPQLTAGLKYFIRFIAYLEGRVSQAAILGAVAT